MEKNKTRWVIIFFFAMVAFAALGNGLSDAVYGNYFKEVYDVSASQRGFIEFPRELPGILCILVIAIFGFLGDLRISLIAQLLACAGLVALGLLTPVFGVMLIFLFINSMGMHLFVPLQDAIGMSLAEPGRVGKRVGQYASLRSGVSFLAALAVFFGFRTGVFTFHAPVKSIFLIGAGAFLLAAASCALVISLVKPKRAERKKLRLVFRREYKYYYILTILHGVQKQIAYVYGSWVIIDILLKGADIMALLTIVSSFICIFFMSLLGRWIDRFGVKRMLYVEALAFIAVYILYGVVVWGMTQAFIPSAGWPVMCIYFFFIVDRMSMQMGVVRTIYLRDIALDEGEITHTLSTGLSLDHIVSIIAAFLGGIVWDAWGSHWVFFLAASFSIGNLIVAWKVRPDLEKAHAEKARKLLANE